MPVTTLSDNKQLIDFYVPGGKGRRERITFVGTRLDALKHELHLMRLHGSPAGNDAPLQDLFPAFEVWYRTETSKTTADDVVRCWDKSLRPAFGSRRVSQLSPVLVDQYKSARLASGVKKRTIDKELSYLSSIIKWCTDPERGYSPPLSFRIRRFPPKQTKAPLPIVPSRSELQRFEDALREGKGIRPRFAGQNADRWGLYLLMYDGGLRRSEATSIRGEKVDLENDVMMVKGKGGKERVVPIHTDRLRAELQERIKAHGRGYLYINQQTEKPYIDMSDSMKSIARAIGLDKRIYNHLFRHSRGAHSLQAGMSLRAIQTDFGHSTVKVTELYTQVSAELQKTEGAKFGNFVETRIPAQPDIAKRRKTE